MEESEYKSTYNELAAVRCVFEKALTGNHARCSLAKHFCLADREGYACKDDKSALKCRELLENLRENSLFVLKLRGISGPLLHNMEIRVQVGGLTGLVKLVTAKTEKIASQLQTEDISRLIKQVIEKFGCLDDLPYSEVIQSVEQFQGRRRQRK